MTSHFRIIAWENNTLLMQAGLNTNDLIPLNLYCCVNHGLYSPSGETRTWLDIELEKRGTRVISATTSTFHSLAKIDTHSDLLATVPERTANDMAMHYPLTDYRHPLEGIKSDLMMAWHYRNDKKPEQAWFRSIVIDERAKL